MALTLAPSSARADTTKEQCVKANADGQALRLDGKLAAARALLEACGDPSCPGIVRDDCAQRLNELDRAQPTIVFDVKDAAGADASAVSVSADGHPLADKLAGMALRIDPGEHVFVFTAIGLPPVTRRFVVKEGEKDRREQILLEGVAPSSAPTPVASAGGTSPGGIGTQQVLGVVAGGLGVVGLAVGSVFGILTFAAVSQQKADCGSGTDCSSHAQALSDHSTASTDGTISTVSVLAGGALLVGGAVLFFTSPSPNATPAPSTGLQILPGLSPGGGAVSVLGRF